MTLQTSAFKAYASATSRTRTAFFPTRIRRPLYQGSPLDDILFAQPVNLGLRAVHSWGKHRATRAAGVSVIVVNYRTRPVTTVALAAVRHFSPPGTEIILIDNASRDGSRDWLRSNPSGSRVVRLPTNIGHGRALDVGAATSRAPIVVTLDSDAFPYREGWLEGLVTPLSNGECSAIGMWGRRDRLHPACAAFKRSEYYRVSQSFANFNLHLDRGEDPVFGINTWDTGELVFEALGRDLVRILPTSDSPHGGTDMAGMVYHHASLTVDRMNGTSESRMDSWRGAVAALLPSGFIDSVSESNL